MGRRDCDDTTMPVLSRKMETRSSMVMSAGSGLAAKAVECSCVE
jgi:hypothetical protein